MNSITANNTNTSLIKGTENAVVEQESNLSEWKEMLDTFIRSLDVMTSSRRAYKKALTQFFMFVDRTKRSFATLRREDIIAYKDYLFNEKGRRHSDLTVSLYICAVRIFYEWAEASRLYPNIARGVRSPRRKNSSFKKMHLNEQQGNQYLELFHSARVRRERDVEERNTADDTDTRKRRFTNLPQMSLRDYAAVCLMLYCGLRTIEVTRLNIEDVTFRLGQRVLKVHGKGHDSKDAYVVLIDDAWKPLKQYLDTRKGALASEPLFVCEGYDSCGRRLSTRRLQAICKNGFRAIGLDGHEYSAHSLRHTTGVMIVKHGGQLLDVQTVLRHKSTSTSQIYIESAMEEIRMKNAPENRLNGCFQTTDN